jgi:ubiquinone/menaquinone biosynthesis C-methylase UbiE
MKVSSTLKESYSSQYEDSIVEWRNKSAKYKAQNAIDISKSIKFDSVLEVGCGEGSILYWLSKLGFSRNLHGIEISESGIELTKSKKIEHLKSVQLFDGYHIPFEDNRFDLVICSHVMEHVEHERVLLREIKRVSRYQIFEVPIDFSFYVDKKINHFLSYGHINIYTPALFRFLLKSEKFIPRKDKCCLFEEEMLQHLYKGNKFELYKVKCKQLILKMFPYLLGIKPSSYVILTENMNDEKLTIF